jgi:hypothetical protein
MSGDVKPGQIYREDGMGLWVTLKVIVDRVDAWVEIVRCGESGAALG